MEKNIIQEEIIPVVSQHYYYAQINNEGICCGISDLSGEIIADNMICLESYDMSILGRYWDGENWQEVETSKENTEEIPSMPSESSPTLSEIKELQLAQMEAMAEMYEQNEENHLNDLEIQATIYETLLAIQEGGTI